MMAQGQMYPQALNHQPAMFGQDNRVNQMPLYNASMGIGTNPQLSNTMGNYPGMIQYRSGIPQQQIMGIPSNMNNTNGVRMALVYTEGAANDTNIHPVSFQSTSISNPNNVSLYSHSTNLVVPVPEQRQRAVTPPFPLPPLVIILCTRVSS